MRQRFLGPLQQDRRRRIGGGNWRERLGAADKIAPAPARQCMRIGGRYDLLLGAFFAVARKRLVNANRTRMLSSSRQAKPAARSNVLLAAMIVVPKYLLAPSSRDATFTVSPITV